MNRRSLDLDLDRDLDRALALAPDLVLLRAAHPAAAQEGTPAAGRPPPGRVARGLVCLAVRVLPVRTRPRYTEEFRGELRDLARAQRWGYALRTLAGAWALRRALTETVHTADGAPGRRAPKWW